MIYYRYNKGKEVNTMNSKKMNTVQVFGMVAGRVTLWLVSAAFIWWGWNTFAWHFNLPRFEYMEVFAMRMALTYIMKIFWQKT